MKLALVGVGGAGGRIVDRLRAREQAIGRQVSLGNALVFDTAAPAGEFGALTVDQHVRVGDAHPAVGPDGVDGSLDLAISVTEEELPEIRRSLDVLDLHELEAILLIAGFGGATGAGMGSLLLDELQALFDLPVYAVGVLPSADDGDGAAVNASRALRTFVPTADNVILLDNEAWRRPDEGEPVPYERVNDELATRIVSLFGTGERPNAKIPENAIDSSDIRRTFESGGISSIGYATLEIDHPTGRLQRWLRSLFGNGADGAPVDPTRIKHLVRDAVESNLTLPCNIQSAERSLVVLSGPSSRLSRRGFELARHWLEQETDTVELLAGDEPHERISELTVSVLLSNVSDVQSIDELHARAAAAGTEGSDDWTLAAAEDGS